MVVFLILFTLCFSVSFSVDAQSIPPSLQSVSELIEATHDTDDWVNPPNLIDKTPMAVALIESPWSRYAEMAIRDFSQKTGIPISIEVLTSKQLSRTIAMSSESMTHYDVMYLPSMAIDALVSQGRLANLTKLNQVEDKSFQLLADMPDIAIRAANYNDTVVAVPVSITSVANHYRKELFEHYQERQDFFARYGYALSPPTSLESLRDVAEFFTRKEGQMLAGVTLQHDLYGWAFAAQTEQQQRAIIEALMTAFDGYWLQSEDDQFLHLGDEKIWYQALTFLNELLEFAPPEPMTMSELMATDLFTAGWVAMLPFASNSQWGLNKQVDENIIGAQATLAPSIGQPVVIDINALAINSATANAPASYWLLRYLLQPKHQLALALLGGMPSQNSVLSDPLLSQATTAKYYQSLAFVSSQLIDGQESRLERLYGGSSVGWQHSQAIEQELSALLHSSQIHLADLSALRQRIATRQWLIGVEPLMPIFMGASHE